MEKPTIFISHITEEKEIAKAVKEFLEKRFLKTINVFASSHEDSLKLGDEWLGTIKKSMKECKLIIILCSPISIARPWINFEAGAGWVKDIPVIPLCHSGLTLGKLPVPINSFQGGLINNQDDIKKLFARIAELLAITAPDSNDIDFFTAINNFETEIKNTSLVKDTTFIHNLLNRQIDLLKFSIFASTLDYLELQNIDFNKNNIKDHKYTFNDIHFLFNIMPLMMSSQEKVYQTYYKSFHQLADNIKFILTYSSINISPSIRELLNTLLFSVIKVDDCYKGISITEIPSNKSIKEMIIKMIKEEPLPATRKISNIINYYIEYYESLLFFQSWVVEYEKEVNNILKVKN